MIYYHILIVYPYTETQSSYRKPGKGVIRLQSWHACFDACFKCMFRQELCVHVYYCIHTYLHADILTDYLPGRLTYLLTWHADRITQIHSYDRAR